MLLRAWNPIILSEVDVIELGVHGVYVWPESVLRQLGRTATVGGRHTHAAPCLPEAQWAPSGLGMADGVGLCWTAGVSSKQRGRHLGLGRHL